MRDINKIIVHCSATKEEQEFFADDIRRWHKARGFSDIGYHFVINLDGVTILGAFTETPTAQEGGMFYSASGDFYLGY